MFVSIHTDPISPFEYSKQTHISYQESERSLKIGGKWHLFHSITPHQPQVLVVPQSLGRGMCM